MLTVVGILITLSVVALLLTGRWAPLVVLTLTPFIGAVVAGFGPADISAFYLQGLVKVAPVATMFVFAITFFGIMQDVGLFAPLIRGLLSLTRGNVVAVAVCTALLGMAAHLDGAGATTFLLTVPALLPLYRELRMNPYLMLMLLALGAGIVNMMPWAGPLGRASAVIGIDASLLWSPLIPLQATGAALLLLLASYLGWREQKRIAAASPIASPISASAAVSATPIDAERVPGWRQAVNGAIFSGVLIALLTSMLPAAYTFMLGAALALAVNFRNQRAQIACLHAHAPNALLMGAIILAAGSFLGVMDGSGMLKAIAHDLVSILPDSLVPQLHLVLGLFGLPMELLLSTDAYYFGLLPIVNEIVTEHGVSPAVTVYALTIGNIIGTFISPFSAALWLALGLAGLDMGRHIRHSFGWMWSFSIVLMGVAVAIRLIPVTLD
ncbi:citrate transporter [Burkholderia ubonensis]|uniref:Citrate transporter n=1 Tax=Burkholderia ubonensis TaxID=101571 RepID=A0AAW3N9L3_9BURK|nr:citrate transporter [Burkholderia ubonensis]